MSERKGMLHYKVGIKQKVIRLVPEERVMYVAVAARLEIRKAEQTEAWIRMYRREGELSFHKPKEKVTDRLVLHNDQGTQYTSRVYHVLVDDITPSMSHCGNCWDNVPLEFAKPVLTGKAVSNYSQLAFFFGGGA